MNNTIAFHYETDFLLENTESFIKWIKDVILEENKELGEVNYIFCDDKYLMGKNIKYLNHDTLTDIITFNYCEGNMISSDIMISVERVMENDRAEIQISDNVKVEIVKSTGIQALANTPEPKK